jgi:hypothetical protein
MKLQARIALLLWAAAPLVPAAPQPASPASVTLMPIRLAEPLRVQLHDRYGDEEADVISGMLRDSLQHALAAAGIAVQEGAALRVEFEIVEARPTHPTQREMRANPGIDFLASRSLGGARMSGALRATDGHERKRLDCSYYAPSLWEISQAASAWADAQLSFERCADELVTALQRLGTMPDTNNTGGAKPGASATGGRG